MSISKEKFKEMLREKGLKVTNQRILVLEVLADHRDKHLTAEDIYELVREDYPEIGLATIYRTVQLLLEMQLVDRINLDDGCARYEIGEFFDGEERHHHHHLICRTCGKIIPFKDDLLEDLEDKIEETTGFHVQGVPKKRQKNSTVSTWRCNFEERKQWKNAYHSTRRSGKDRNEHHSF